MTAPSIALSGRWWKFRCPACNATFTRYRNVRKCPTCGGKLERLARASVSGTVIIEAKGGPRT